MQRDKKVNLGNPQSQCCFHSCLTAKAANVVRHQRVERTGLRNRNGCSVLEPWHLVSYWGKAQSQRLRSLLSGCIHEIAVRWRDRQHASGASPATWLNLSLRVSLAQSGPWGNKVVGIESLTQRTVLTSSMTMGEAGEALHVVTFSPRITGTRGFIHIYKSTIMQHDDSVHALSVRPPSCVMLFYPAYHFLIS